MSKIYTWFALITVYVIFELACKYQIGMQFRVIECTIYYLVPYGIVLLIGTQYEKFSKKQKLIIFGLAFICFIILEILYFMKYGEYCFTQKYKYPPRHLVLAHAFSYILLFMLFEKRDFLLGRNKFVLFVSKSSLWIYLWHILVLQIAAKFIPNTNWYIKYYFVYSISLLIVFIQNKILDVIDSKRRIPFLKIFRG